MMFHKIKSALFNFFHFNKQERNGVFVLCIIIALLFCIRILLPLFSDKNNNLQLFTIVITNKDSVAQHIDDTVTKYNNLNDLTELNKSYSNNYFVFNPNTITEEDAVKLGFSKKLSATLINFRNKGGKFFKSEDLKKLYGLSPKLFNQLEPYILIPNNKKVFKYDSTYSKKYDAKPKYQKRAQAIVDINTADSLTLVYLKGIGPGFTKRIIKYRTMLGGFYSINQLKEVYGMTDSLYQSLVPQIQVDVNAISKIPINSIDFNSLRKHPYFNFQSAQAIINFRFKHGKLDENGIKNLGIFSDEKLKQILPYLNY